MANNKPVKADSCPNCFSSVKYYDFESKYLVCSACGSLLEIRNGFFLTKSSFFKPKSYKPLSTIKLGTAFIKDNKSYVAISRSRWTCKVEEYWQENSESGFENSRYVYDEWCFRANDGSEVYLSEENDSYSLAKGIEVKFPNFPRYQQIKDFSNNSFRVVQESGVASLQYFEGESAEAPEKGEELFFGFYIDAGVNYIVEWEKDENDNPINVLFFKETEVTRDQLAKYSFIAPDNVKIKDFKLLHPTTSELKKLCKSLSLAGLILSIVLFLGSFFKSSISVFESTFPLFDTLNYKIQNSGIQHIYTSQLPINIDNANKVYKLTFSVNSLPSNSETEGEVRLIDNSRSEVLNVEGNFYHEISEGETETSTAIEKYFSVSNPGTYYLEVSVPNDSYQSFSFDVKIEKDILLSRYFGISIILFFILYTYVFSENGGQKLKKHLSSFAS